MIAFTEEKPWIHIDIAGSAYIEEEKPYFRAGCPLGSELPIDGTCKTLGKIILEKHLKSKLLRDSSMNCLCFIL